MHLHVTDRGQGDDRHIKGIKKTVFLLDKEVAQRAGQNQSKKHYERQDNTARQPRQEPHRPWPAYARWLGHPWLLLGEIPSKSKGKQAALSGCVQWRPVLASLERFNELYSAAAIRT